jgi:hypothetical protein
MEVEDGAELKSIRVADFHPFSPKLDRAAASSPFAASMAHQAIGKIHGDGSLPNHTCSTYIACFHAHKDHYHTVSPHSFESPSASSGEIVFVSMLN